MAMKKSAPKKPASKKGDEPVRAGVGKKAVAKSPSNLDTAAKAMGPGLKFSSEPYKAVAKGAKKLVDKLSSKEPAKKNMRESTKKTSGQSRPPDREYQGGIGSLKKPTVIPAGYRVIMLMSDPPRYKLVPKPSK
jgi:hypothetical protein